MILFFGNTSKKVFAVQVATKISSENINSAITIVHLSDLHSKQFGKNDIKLIENITDINPDLIVFTGDLIDSRRNNYINEPSKISFS